MINSTSHQGQEATDPVNFRDLGGQPVDGGQVRTGLLYRSDDVSTCTIGFADRIVDDLGICRVVDLRSAEEVAFTGRGPLAARQVDYHHMSLLAAIGPVADIDPTPAGVGSWYLALLEDNASRLAQLLTLLAVAEGVTVFHCAAGKDRTGVLAAVLLVALGADHGTIAADYARTADRLAEVHRRVGSTLGALLSSRMPAGLKSVPAGLGAPDSDRRPQHPLMLAEASSMAAMLELADDRYGNRHGDLLTPLRAAGLTDQTLVALRHRYRAAS